MIPKHSKMFAGHPQTTQGSASHTGLPSALRDTESCVKGKGIGKGRGVV